MEASYVTTYRGVSYRIANCRGESRIHPHSDPIRQLMAPQITQITVSSLPTSHARRHEMGQPTVMC